MKEHPILFSSEMVNAILQGRKTMTRRVVAKSNCKPVGLYGYGFSDLNFNDVVVVGIDDFYYLKVSLPVMNTRHHIYSKWEVGDHLWVREMLYQNGELGLSYVADNEDIDEDIIPEDHKPYRNYAFCNIPSIHMPKWACRIFLEVTEIKVERLQDMTEEDAISEGVWLDKSVLPNAYTVFGMPHWRLPVDAFINLWESINWEDSWEANPWVWVISFNRIVAVIEKGEGNF